MALFRTLPVLLLAAACTPSSPLKGPGLNDDGSLRIDADGPFLVVVTQASDVLQYLFGKAFGRHALMPSLSPDKTVEGMVGGVLSATVVGALLTPLTPFGLGETTALAFFVVNAGWLGGMVMSAIKRDAGVKDYGAFIDGHGGVLDRVDSLVFAAPALFHVVRWLHSTT